ncbi:putative holin [Citrobacter portucalensis]|uniref:putative holin n=1 Tax=Citrobacter portucalensis TaxID=1639133 RepID=UPI001F5B6799|nr:putative holin [Citrobacter portucalensis]
MSEPLSGSGAVALTIGGASVFGLLTNSDFGVVVGAFAGALFVVTQQKEIPVWIMVIHLLIAFVVGVLGAGVAASLMQWLTACRNGCSMARLTPALARRTKTATRQPFWWADLTALPAFWMWWKPIFADVCRTNLSKT